MKRQRQERDLLAVESSIDVKEKENVVGRVGNNCKSRIPVPTKAKASTAFTCVKSKENYASRSEVKSQVRQVPDFKKLHEQEQLKLEKAKQERRKPTEIQEFALTPSAKRIQLQHWTSDVQFEEDPRSLKAILDSKPIHGEIYQHSINRSSVKTEVRQSTRGPHKTPWNDSPTCLVGRYSVYAKSMAEARGATHTTPGTLHRPGGNAGILDELCDKLMASTLRKTIRQSRVAPINAVMQDIKLNLNGQFAECLEEQQHPACHLPPSVPLWRAVTAIEVAGQLEDSVSGENKEVEQLLQYRPKLYGISRSDCPNPVASELQKSFFVPVCM